MARALVVMNLCVLLDRPWLKIGSPSRFILLFQQDFRAYALGLSRGKPVAALR
jgi:hypothetical protein